MFISAIRGMIGEIIEAGSIFENARLALDNLTGSAAAGGKAFDDLKKFALSTPFQFSDLLDAARKLKAVNVETENIIPVMQRLGDIVSVTGSNLSRGLDHMVETMARIQNRGKMMSQDMRSFVAMGVPMGEALAKQMGLKDTPAVMARIRRGGVDFATVWRAAMSLGEDPRFARGMEKSMATYTGMMSNFKDLMQQTFADVGDPLFQSIKRTTKMVVDYMLSGGGKQVGEMFKSMFASIGSAVEYVTPSILAAMPSIIQFGGVFLAITVGLPALVGGLRLLYSVLMLIPNQIYGMFSSVVGLVSGVAGTVFSVVGTAASFAMSVASGLMQVVGTALGALYAAASDAASVLRVVGGVAGSAIAAIFRFGYGLTETLISAARTVLLMTANIADKLGSIGAAALTTMVNVGNALFAVMASIVSVGLALPLIFSALAVPVAALAAAVVTLGIGLSQLYSMLTTGIVAGISAAWVGFKAIVAGVYTWTADRVNDIRGGITRMWGSFREGAASAAVAAGEAIQKVAGFLWNFRENIQKIGEWWSLHWRTALADIGNFAAMVIDNIATNFAIGISTMANVVYTTITGVWKLVSLYFKVGLIWLRSEWDNLWEDAGTVFKTFLGNLFENFKKLFPLIQAIAQYIGHEIRDASGLFATGEGQRRQRQMDTGLIEFHAAMLMGDIEAARQAKLKVSQVTGPDFFSKLKLEEVPVFRGPLEGLPGMKTGTGPYDLGALITQLNKNTAEFIIPDILKSIGEAISIGVENMWPIVSADFKAESPWKALLASLNLSLPKGGVKEITNQLFGRPGVPQFPDSQGQKDIFSGFADMWKKIQKDFYGAKLEDFAKRTMENTLNTAEAANRAASATERTAAAVEKMNVGMAR